MIHLFIFCVSYTLRHETPVQLRASHALIYTWGVKKREEPAGTHVTAGRTHITPCR